MSYRVKLEIFEGPLDLLLHLINRMEIDIYDIPMASLTEQYIQHLHAMRVLQLDELSEYLVLAATLLEIKSKMLLPVHEEDEFENHLDYEIENDPREELVARLIEYRKYKDAAVQLEHAAAERSEYFTKMPEDLSAYGEVCTTDTEEQLQVFDLIGAFQKMLQRKRVKAPLTASITRNEQSVSDRMNEIVSLLEKKGGSCDFYSLFQEGDTPALVLTFLSLLELMKRAQISVRQQNNFEEMTVSFQQGAVGIGN